MHLLCILSNDQDMILDKLSIARFSDTFYSFQNVFIIKNSLIIEIVFLKESFEVVVYERSMQRSHEIYTLDRLKHG